MNRAASSTPARSRRAPSRRRRGSRRGPPWRDCRRRPARTGSHRSRRPRSRSNGPRRPARPPRWPAPCRACRGSGTRPDRGGMPASTASAVSVETCVRHADPDGVPEADLVDAERRGAAAPPRRREPDRPARCTDSRRRSTRSRAATSPARRPAPGPARTPRSISSTVMPMLARVKASVVAGEHRDRLGAGRLGAGQAAQVRDEHRVADAGSPRQRREQLVGVRELRDRARRDEARRLDLTEPGVGRAAR